MQPPPQTATTPDLSDFVRDRAGGRLVRRRYAELIDALEPTGSVDAAAPQRTSGGRQTHPVLTLGNGERVVVRHYLRGGLLRHLNRDLYFAGHRAFDEVRVTELAGRAGVQVPHVVAAVEERRRIGYRAWLIVLWIADAVDLSRWLVSAESNERTVVLSRLGEEIGKMHRAGISHADLNLKNVLVSEPAGTRAKHVYLIDFDRARAFGTAVPRRRRARELRRFARSARKLVIPLTSADWGAIRAGYGDDWPLTSDP